jgi:hypothetical protein
LNVIFFSSSLHSEFRSCIGPLRYERNVRLLHHIAKKIMGRKTGPK